MVLKSNFVRKIHVTLPLTWLRLARASLFALMLGVLLASNAWAGELPHAESPFSYDLGDFSTSWTLGLTPTAHDRFAVAWFERHGSSFRALFDVIDERGNGQGRVVLSIDGRDEYGRLAILPADEGQFVLVNLYRSQSDAGVAPHLIARLIDDRGQVLRGPMVVSEEAIESDSFDFDLRRLSSGGFVVAWLHGADEHDRIALRRLNGQGEPVGAMVPIMGELSINHRHPRLGVARDGAITVAERYRLALFDAEARPIAVARAVPKDQEELPELLRANGGCSSRRAFLATWVDPTAGGGRPLRGRWLDGSGTAEDRVLSFPPTEAPRDDSVALDETVRAPRRVFSYDAGLTSDCKSLIVLWIEVEKEQARLLTRLFDAATGAPHGDPILLAGPPTWLNGPRLLEISSKHVTVAWVAPERTRGHGQLQILSIPLTDLQRWAEVDAETSSSP